MKHLITTKYSVGALFLSVGAKMSFVIISTFQHDNCIQKFLDTYFMQPLKRVSMRGNILNTCLTYCRLPKNSDIKHNRKKVD